MHEPPDRDCSLWPYNLSRPSGMNLQRNLGRSWIYTVPGAITGYASEIALPASNAVISPGTTLNCGAWYVALAGDDCASIMVENVHGFIVPAD